MSRNPADQMLRTLRMWRDSCDGTCKCFRSKLDGCSVFCGRNLWACAGVLTPIPHTSVPTSEHNLSSHLQCSNEGSLCQPDALEHIHRTDILSSLALPKPTQMSTDTTTQPLSLDVSPMNAYGHEHQAAHFEPGMSVASPAIASPPNDSQLGGVQDTDSDEYYSL